MCGLVQDHDTVDHTVDHTVPVDLSGSPRIALVLLELPAEVTPAARHEKSSGHQFSSKIGHLCSAAAKRCCVVPYLLVVF